MRMKTRMLRNKYFLKRWETTLVRQFTTTFTFNLPIIPFIKEIEKFLDLFIDQRNIINSRIKERQDLPTDKINMEILQSAIQQLEILRKDVLQEIQILPTHSRDKRQLAVFATILGVVGHNIRRIQC